MSLSWAIGTIIAPLAGGLLSNPTEKYPGVFSPGGYLETFPYLLPCLLSVLLLLISTIFCFLFMKVTRKFVSIDTTKNFLHVSVEMSRLPANSDSMSSARASASYAPLHTDNAEADTSEKKEDRESDQPDFALLESAEEVSGLALGVSLGVEVEGGTRDVCKGGFEEADEEEMQCFLCSSRGDLVAVQSDASL
jgi:hypothetical protein